MKPYHSFIFLAAFINASCSPSRSLSDLRNITQVGKAMERVETLKKTPTKVNPKAYSDARKDFLDRMKIMLSKNEEIIERNAKRERNFGIVGVVVGVGGGIAGLFVSDNKVGSIASMVTGGTIAIGSQVFSKTDRKRASGCVIVLRKELQNFESNWSAFNPPATNSQYDKFVSDQTKLISEADKSKCFSPEGIE